jgi:hypothetical protein
MHSVQEKWQHFRGILHKIKLGGALLLCPVALFYHDALAQIEIVGPGINPDTRIELVENPPNGSRTFKYNFVNTTNSKITVGARVDCPAETTTASIDPPDPADPSQGIPFSLLPGMAKEVFITFADRPRGAKAGDSFDCIVSGLVFRSQSPAIVGRRVHLQLLSLYTMSGPGSATLVVNPPGEPLILEYSYFNNHFTSAISIRTQISAACLQWLNVAYDPETLIVEPRKSEKVKIRLEDKTGSASVGDVLDCLVQAETVNFTDLEGRPFSRQQLLTIEIGPFVTISGPGIAPSAEVSVIVNPPDTPTKIQYTFQSKLVTRTMEITPDVFCPPGDQEISVKFDKSPFTLAPNQSKTLSVELSDKSGGAGIGDKLICKIKAILTKIDETALSDARMEMGIQVQIVPVVEIFGPIEATENASLCSQPPTAECQPPVPVVENPPDSPTLATFKYFNPAPQAFVVRPTASCSGVEIRLASAREFTLTSRQTVLVKFEFRDLPGGVKDTHGNNTLQCQLGAQIQLSTNNSLTSPAQNTPVEIFSFMSEEGTLLHEKETIRQEAFELAQAADQSARIASCNEIQKWIVRPAGKQTRTPLLYFLDKINLLDAFKKLSDKRGNRIRSHLRKMLSLCDDLRNPTTFRESVQQRKAREVLRRVVAIAVEIYGQGRRLASVDRSNDTISALLLPSLDMLCRSFTNCKAQIGIFTTVGRGLLQGSWQIEFDSTRETLLQKLASLRLAAGVYFVRVNVSIGQDISYSYLEKMIVWPR